MSVITSDIHGVIENENLSGEVPVAEVERIFAEGDGVWKSDLDSVELIESGRVGVDDSVIDEVGTVKAKDTGIKESEIGHVDSVLSEEICIDDSIIEYVEEVEGVFGVVNNSDITEVERIFAEKRAIEDSKILEAGLVESEGHGMHEAEVGKLTSLKSDKTALSDSKIDTAALIASNERLGANSEIGEVRTALANIYESEEEPTTYGFVDCEIGLIENLQVSEYALESSTVSRLGDLDAVRYGITNSQVQRVKGDLIVENYPIYESHVRKVEGDIDTDSNAIIGSNVSLIDGNIACGGAVFDESDLSVLLSEEILAKGIDVNSYGNLVVTDKLTTDSINSSIVVTDDGNGNTSYEGDIQELKNLLREDEDKLSATQLLNPDKLEYEDIDDVLETEQKLREHFNKDVKELKQHMRSKGSDDMDKIASYDFLDDKYFAQIIESVDDEIERLEKRKVERFGDLVGELESGERQKLISLLESKEENVGNDIYRIAKNAKLNISDNPVSKIREFLDFEFNFEYKIDNFLEDSPYKEDLEQVLDRKRSELNILGYLAELNGEDIELDLEKRLKKWEGERRSRGEKRYVNIESLTKELEKELESKQRAYTIETLSSIGEDKLKRKYEEITGEKEENISDEELAALEIHENYIFNRDSVRNLLNDDIYSLESNQRWLDKVENPELVTEGLGKREYKVSDGSEQTKDLRVWVAEPLEAVKMGDYFPDSCFKVGKARAWSSLATAVDANKQVIYAENGNGNIVGRLQVGFTSDGKISKYEPWNNTDYNVEEALESYAEEWSDELEMALTEQEKNVEKLESDRWHNRVI
jgi:hypothetical protein